MSLTTTIKVPGDDGKTFTFTTKFDANASNAAKVLKGHNDIVDAFITSGIAEMSVEKPLHSLKDDASTVKDETRGWGAFGGSYPVSRSLDGYTVGQSEDGTWAKVPTPKASVASKLGRGPGHKAPRVRTSEKSGSRGLGSGSGANNSQSSIKLKFIDFDTLDLLFSMWFKSTDNVSTLTEKFVSFRGVPYESVEMTYDDVVLYGYESLPYWGIDDGAEITVRSKCIVDGKFC